MVVKLSNKMKLSLVVIIGLILAGATFIYQKLFGGRIESMPINKQAEEKGNSEPGGTETQNVRQEVVAVSKAETPTEGIKDVIGRTGSLDFIQEGQKVLIKPNVNSDDPAPGTTHPEAVAEVVRQVKKRGAYVIVADRSNPRWKTIPAMKKVGIYQAASEAGADEIIGFEEGDWIRVNPEGADNWSKGFRIPALLKEVDHIISVPVLHTHSITSHSLAIKNLVGLIHPTDRMIFHSSSKIEEMIAEIGLAVKPSLTVIDGTVAFIDGGPSSGTVAKSKVYLASKDTLLADFIGVELLRRENAKLFFDNPWDSVQIRRTLELNLSSFSKEEIEKEIDKI